MSLFSFSFLSWSEFEHLKSHLIKAHLLFLVLCFVFQIKSTCREHTKKKSSEISFFIFNFGFSLTADSSAQCVIRSEVSLNLHAAICRHRENVIFGNLNFHLAASTTHVWALCMHKYSSTQGERRKISFDDEFTQIYAVMNFRFLLIISFAPIYHLAAPPSPPSSQRVEIIISAIVCSTKFTLHRMCLVIAQSDACCINSASERKRTTTTWANYTSV